MLILFYALAIVMVISAVAIVTNKNPMYSALCLILNMIGIACMFAMLQAHFLAVVQLIVYAGAVMVLVLFVLMLLNVKAEQFKASSLVVLVTAMFTGVIFLYFLLPYLQATFAPLTLKFQSVIHLPQAIGSVKEIGLLLFSKYVFTFEVASILIMVGLVGAVMLGSRTIHKKNS